MSGLTAACQLLELGLIAFVFDLDAESLQSVRHALPEWSIRVPAPAADLFQEHHSAVEADLLIVGTRPRAAETLRICRNLRRQSNATPLVVLVPQAQTPFVTAALAAGADSCLVVPIHPQDLASTLSRALAGNRPGRHTLDLNRAQIEDSWRDEGGEA